MNTQTAGTLALALPVQTGTIAADDVSRGSEMVFVQEGNTRSTREIGNKWTSKEGALVCGGTGNFLVAGKALGAGDFQIRARLSLERLDGTAASLAFGQNHFGFDGRSGKLFVEGAALGSARSVGETADFIAPGRPFDVEVVRHRNTVTFRIDGNEVHRGEYRLDAPLAVALRPWRATMAVSGFSASGDLVDVTAETIAKLRRDWKQPPPQPIHLLANVTVGGMALDGTAPPVGLVVRPELGLMTSTHVDGQLVHEAEDNLFETRSNDDGRTWSEPKPTSLIHPDAPPMLFHHPSGKTLVAFHHNRHSGSHFKHTDRSEIWVSLSTDEGRTWSEPRFVFANALDATTSSPWHNYRCSYLDAFHRRLVSFSADGATKWTKPVFDETLFEPICFGSVQRFSTKPEAARNRILFVNPNRGSRARRNLTVRLSCDEGRSWPIQKVLEPGIAGYSDLAVSPDGSIYCLYERGGLGGNHYHTQGVTVAKFSLQWLTDGRDVHSQGERQ